MNTIPLHESILKAKRAIKRAGFQSGSFKPKGGTLTVDVFVPVTFDATAFGFDDDGMRQTVWDRIIVETTNRMKALGVIPGQPIFPSNQTISATIRVEPEGVSCINPPSRPPDLRTKRGREWKKRMATTT